MVCPGPTHVEWSQTKHCIREVCEGGASTYWTDIVSQSCVRIAGLLTVCRILFARRIAQVWYTKIGDAEGAVWILNSFTQTHILASLEKTLVTLRKQQREKIEEIKKKTNYYTTRNLLDRYDESVSNQGTPQRRQVLPQTPVQAPRRQPNQKPGQAKPQTVPTSQIPLARTFPGRYLMDLSNKSLAMPVTPQPPPRKQWYDKLADAILGDDDTTGSPSSRYALICQRCFAHNGLVKESVWQDTRESNFVLAVQTLTSMFVSQSMYAQNAVTSIHPLVLFNKASLPLARAPSQP